MKLHEITISGNKEETLPNGYTIQDLNFSVKPFEALLREKLGRGRNLSNIKKLNITLYKDNFITENLVNLPIEKGFVGNVNQGGFDFERYFNLKPVDQLILLANTVEKILNRLNLNPDEVTEINAIINEIRVNAPYIEDAIHKFIKGHEKYFNDQNRNNK